MEERAKERLVQIIRTAGGYFSKHVFKEITDELGHREYFEIMDGEDNQPVRMRKRPDTLAWWLKSARDHAEQARSALAASDMVRFAFHYGEAIANFNFPFREIGLKSLSGARAGGKRKTTARRDIDLAATFLQAKLTRSADLPKLTMAEFASQRGLKPEAGRKAIMRGLRLLDENPGE
jgi:hypothetical protein